jgi:hypothetical protein
VIELRADRRRDAPSKLAVIANGDRAAADVHVRHANGDWQPSEPGEIGDFASLLALRVDLPAGLAPKLKVWAHAISPDGSDEPLPVRVTVRDDRGAEDLELGPDGDAMVRLEPVPCQVEITLTQSSA